MQEAMGNCCHMGVQVEATPLWGVLTSEWRTSVCRSDSTHSNADAIGSHLLDSVAIAVQRCTGMALRASRDREMTRALGVRAA